MLATVETPASPSVQTNAPDRVDASKEAAFASLASVELTALFLVAAVVMVAAMCLEHAFVTKAGVVLNVEQNLFALIHSAQTMEIVLKASACASLALLALRVLPRPWAVCLSVDLRANATSVHCNANAKMALQVKIARQRSRPAKITATIEGYV